MFIDRHAFRLPILLKHPDLFRVPHEVRAAYYSSVYVSIHGGYTCSISDHSLAHKVALVGRWRFRLPHSVTVSHAPTRQVVKSSRTQGTILDTEVCVWSGIRGITLAFAVQSVFVLYAGLKMK